VFFTMGYRSSWSGGAGGGGHGDHGQYDYLQLTSTNYTSWSIQVQAIMEDQGIWEMVEPPEGASSVQSEDRSSKDKKARAHLL
jgi:starvation-inducible outer membrane lipoprotein